MATNSISPGTPRSRVQRLMNEREQRKSNRFFKPNEETNETDFFFNDEGASRDPQSAPKQRLLVVANRLPVSAIREEGNSWHLEMSIGGLVSALLGVKEFDTRWIGWAGVNVPDEAGQLALFNALSKKRCIPVFLSEEIVHQYYNGYCNNMLWPLFHYLGLPQEDRLATTRTVQSQFNAYKKANQMFADVVLQNYQEGDIVWCHDYHLMFLPKCLKERNSNIKIGWFLHTPFPSSEIHRMLPSRSELLKSVLTADLVGFHTYDYARHFVSACTSILGLEGTLEGVEDQGKLTRVAAFPIGIDSDRFIKALELAQVQEHIADLKSRFGDRKVMLGVDRLDMIKGIPHKILAFEEFLEDNTEWRDQVVLVQIAVPSRTDVAEYQKLTSQVHEIVGRINGKFGTLTTVPIHHLDRSLGFHELVALYAVTDVALVTSLRDGMNLVSYEFVACQDSKKGVLILSEFAGAAQSLGAGAILVNPWNVSEVAASIRYALNMPTEEREKRHHLNFMHVMSHTSQEWAATFVSELNDTVVEAQLRTMQVPPPLPIKMVVEKFVKSKSRLLILGFNMTLTEPLDALGRRGVQVRQLEPRLHRRIKESLKKICDDKRTTVIVLSGSDRTVLDDNFGEFNMWLAAENGVFLRHTSREWMMTIFENLNMDWADSVKHVFEYFTERTPRSYYELRETSLVWNYKYADIEFGRLQARDMLQHLWTGPISNAALEIVQGGRSVEVRAMGVTKGAAIARILGEVVHNNGLKGPIDFVLCVGHFLAKDEDVYTFFEPELPRELQENSKGGDKGMPLSPGRQMAKIHLRKQRSLSMMDNRNLGNAAWRPVVHRKNGIHEEGSSLIDLKSDNYFSCAVSRKRSCARYLLGCSDDVATFLKDLADTFD